MTERGEPKPEPANAAVDDTDEEETHVSCNGCQYGVDFVRSGGGLPLRVIQMSWEEVEALIVERGRDIVGDEATALADQLKEPEKKKP